jgi:hypothetical protein
MPDVADIAQLADLLRLTADTTRLLAANTDCVDVMRMLAVARQTDDMARQLDEIGASATARLRVRMRPGDRN